MKRFYLVMQLGSYVVGWFARASMDGKVTGAEITEMVRGGLEIYEEHTGKKVAIDLSDLQGK